MIRLGVLRVTQMVHSRYLPGVCRHHCCLAYGQPTRLVRRLMPYSTDTSTAAAVIQPVAVSGSSRSQGERSLDLYQAAQLKLPPYPQPPDGMLNIINQGQTEHVKPNELYEKIARLPSEGVLATFACNHEHMDKMHLAVSLKRLNAVRLRIAEYNQDKSTKFVEEKMKDIRFQLLVAKITTHGRFYDADVMFNIYRSLVCFGFHIDHPAVGAFQSLVRHSLNNLHLDQLVEVAALGKQPRSRNRLSDLIYLGVKALVLNRTSEFKLLSEMQVLMMCDMYPFILKDHGQVLYTRIKRDLDNSKMEIDHHYAFALLRVQFRMHFFFTVDKHFVKVAMQLCHEHIHSYGIGEIGHIIHSADILRFYNPAIFDDFADRFCSDDGVTLYLKNKALLSLCRMSHYHKGLFESIDNYCLLQESTTVNSRMLHKFMYCCWTYNYFVDTDHLTTMLNLCIKKQLSGAKGMYLDMYLALCLLASSSRIQFPDELANAQLVLHSDDDQMRSKILDPIEKDDERDELLHHVETVETRSENPETGSENPEKGSENPDVQHIHVHVYLSKDNYHHSRFNYLNSLHSGLCIKMQEVITLMKLHCNCYSQKLPNVIHKIEDINIETDDSDMIADEVHKSLLEAATDYNIKCSCHVDPGLHVDYILTKKVVQSANTSNTDSSEDDTLDKNKSLVVKVMPVTVEIRNRPGLKKLPALYMSALRSQGFKCLVIRQRAGSMAIPEEDRISKLQVMIEEAFSQDDNDDLLIV